jgi:hypothetical protein
MALSRSELEIWFRSRKTSPSRFFLDLCMASKSPFGRARNHEFIDEAEGAASDDWQESLDNE